MVTPAAIDQLFDAWLAAYEQATPTDRELAEYVAGFPRADQRRAARFYAGGFLRGCSFCGALSAAEHDRDLATVEARILTLLDLVHALRPPPPESTT